jgi:hypothetical protein
MTAALMNVVRTSHSSPLVAITESALTAAVLQPNIDTSQGIFSIDGMSGKKYRYFINTLIRNVPNARYMEVGSWAGSTLCSAINNNKVQALAIDNWSEFGGPKDKFTTNVQTFKTPEADVWFIEGDFRQVDYSTIGKYNVYLFDGPHEEKDQHDGLAYALPAVENEFVFIVDDWNWERVRAGTFSAIQKCGLRVLFSTEVRTTLNNSAPPMTSFADLKNTDWHNGYFIGVLAKA